MRTALIVLVWGLVLVGGVVAQDSDEPVDSLPPTGVYVTTQDYVALRQGPGRAFGRLAVVPATVTLPAYGRTSDTRWLQVLYEGTYGWISSRYLVWSGEVIDLPVDGIVTYPFVRRAAALGVTTRDTPIYLKEIIPGTEVGYIPAGNEVELTGRFGERGFFRFQVRWQGELYWVGNWNIRITDGDYLRLLDLTYLYRYGRLIGTLESNIALSVGSFRQIVSVWERLSRGESVACSPIPTRVNRSLAAADTQGVVLFGPAVVALEGAITGINATISAFEDACTNPNFTLSPDFINEQLATLDEAERNLIVAGSLLEPLRARNPQIDTTDSPYTGGY